MVTTLVGVRARAAGRNAQETRGLLTRVLHVRPQKQPGEAGYLKPVLDSKGVPKVMSPEMLAGLLMEMGSGTYYVLS